MGNIQHAALDYTETHVPHSYEYVNAAARTGASGFVAGDIGKFALQTDNNSLWMLTATTPTWVAAIITGAITVDTISEDTPGAGVTIDGVLCKDNAVTASGGFIGDINGAVTGTITGFLIGDVKSSNGTVTYNSGTDGTDQVLNGQITGTAIKDEDDMSSDSATHLTSQQAVKAFVENHHANDENYTSSDTFVVPAGIERIFITASAAGGGGGEGSSSSGYGGGGGGSGAWVDSLAIQTTPGETVTITIGAGGAGGDGAGAVGNTGATGGTTSIAAASGTVTLLGGSGGEGAGQTDLHGNGGAGGIILDGPTWSQIGGGHVGNSAAVGTSNMFFAGGAKGGAAPAAGSGGAAGRFGVGAAGSAGSSGLAGSSAGANTGAGGGGGSFTTGTAGGAGGSGQVTINY